MTTILDSVLAEQAWRDGDTALAIETADRVLATGADPDCLAASVAAAAAAADGALFDAADRWRRIATTLGGVPGCWAAGRAALAACLAGDVEAGARELAEARALLPGSAPRGLTVLLDGVAATLDAAHGDLDHAARRLAGLAVASVPTDSFAPQRWDDLAVSVILAGGGDTTARDMLAAYRDRPQSTRRRLLAAWLDLRAGRLADAHTGLAAAGDLPLLRRDALLAAAITVGLARRTGDEGALRATWHRIAPVLHGADVELFLLEAWGELSAGATLVAPYERDGIVDAMAAAVARAGSPPWACAIEAWWALQRAVLAGSGDTGAAAGTLTRLAEAEPRVRPRAAAAHAWATSLAGRPDPETVASAAEALADAGQPWEAATLCGTAAARVSDPAAERDLLGTGRTISARIATTEKSANGLSHRECSVGELLLDGLTHKEIGARLYISPKTVEQHVARLRQKLDATNRSELIAALRTKLTVKLG
jgi:DNA-binding CsgD family transcriptional regulator